MGTSTYFSPGNIMASSEGSNYGVYPNMTTGILRVGTNLTTGSLALGPGMTGGFVNMANGNGSSTIVSIGDKMSASGRVNIVSGAGSVGLATVNICNGLLSKCILNLGSRMNSTGQVNIGGFGTVNMCNSFVITTDSIAASASTDIIDLFTNITTGTLNFLTSLTLNIGNTTATTGNGGTTNIGTGRKCDVTIGNSFNNLTTDYNGCCTINILQVGTGTGYRCMIMERNIGAGIETGTYTIPGAPTGFGNPLVFASVNVTSLNMYMVMVNPNGVNTFQYKKKDFITGRA